MQSAARDGEASLPQGVVVLPLAGNPDARGNFIEIFRTTWPTKVSPRQWGMIQSKPGVMRGMRVHPRHDEFIVTMTGTTLVAVKDLRRAAPSFGRVALLRLEAERPVLVALPHGIAHGFYHVTAGSLLLGASHDYDPADELGFHWADPANGIDWPIADPELSDRDRHAPPLATLLASLGGGL